MIDLTRDVAPASSNVLAQVAQAALVLTEPEAAELLRLSARSLQRLRLTGDGPPFVSLTPAGGRIGYVPSDLESWVRSRARTSTSCPPAPRKGKR